MKKKIAIRVDAHPQFGMGHFFRCLNLSLFLKKKDIEVVFLTLKSSDLCHVSTLLKKHKLDFFFISGENDFIENKAITEKILNEENIKLVLLDLLNPDKTDYDLLNDNQLRFIDREKYILFLKKSNLVVGAITDEMDEINIFPDFVINSACYYPIVDYSTSNKTKYFLGPDYYLLAEVFSSFLKNEVEVKEKVERICVFFGGSDVDNFTIKIINATKKIDNVILDVIVGKSFLEKTNNIEHSKNLIFHFSPENVAEIMAKADLAITHGGNTVYEFAALGVPILSISRRERQNINANYFEEIGALKNLGIGFDLSDVRILSETLDLMNNFELRKRMSEAGKKNVDGRGLSRVNNIINEYMDYCEQHQS